MTTLKQNVILRLTVNVNMNDTKEKSFVRAMLRRMNVLFAKSRPKSGVADILDGAKISEAFEGEQKPAKESKAIIKYDAQKTLGFRVVKPPEKPKLEVIVEQEMQPPELPSEICEG